MISSFPGETEGLVNKDGWGTPKHRRFLAAAVSGLISGTSCTAKVPAQARVPADLWRQHLRLIHLALLDAHCAGCAAAHPAGVRQQQPLLLGLPQYIPAQPWAFNRSAHARALAVEREVIAPAAGLCVLIKDKVTRMGRASGTYQSKAVLCHTGLYCGWACQVKMLMQCSCMLTVSLQLGSAALLRCVSCEECTYPLAPPPLPPGQHGG